MAVTFRLTLAYDGTDFAGWQEQPGQRTIQGVVEAALRRVTGQIVRTSASGRTDSGVHALGQVASFNLDERWTPEVLERALNSELPHDVRVRDVREAPAGFHARRDAIAKRYRYVLDDSRWGDPFRRRYAWHVRQPLDAQQMHVAAQAWLGSHDCRSFQTQGSPRLTTVRTLREIVVERLSNDARGIIHVEIEADGFLYNMARAMVGTLVEIGRGVRPVAWAADVLAACDRRQAGMTAPAHGLYLLWVRYRDEVAEAQSG